MKRSKEELLQQLRTAFGENADSDEAVALYEDVTDSLTDGTEDWEKKYKENDAMWRKKYTDRFFEPSKDNQPPIEEPKEEPKESPLSLDDILTESEG